jgi:hypothetical protein
MQKAPLTPRQQLLPDYSVKTNQAGASAPFFDGFMVECDQDSGAAFLDWR